MPAGSSSSATIARVYSVADWARAVKVLERLIFLPGLPTTIALDTGSEFPNWAIHVWACRQGVTVHFIAPTRRMESLCIGRLNGKDRGEPLNSDWRADLDDARQTMKPGGWAMIRSSHTAPPGTCAMVLHSDGQSGEPSVAGP